MASHGSDAGREPFVLVLHSTSVTSATVLTITDRITAAGAAVMVHVVDERDLAAAVARASRATSPVTGAPVDAAVVLAGVESSERRVIDAGIAAKLPVVFQTRPGAADLVGITTRLAQVLAVGAPVPPLLVAAGGDGSAPSSSPRTPTTAAGSASRGAAHSGSMREVLTGGAPGRMLDLSGPMTEPAVIATATAGGDTRTNVGAPPFTLTVLSSPSTAAAGAGGSRTPVPATATATATAPAPVPTAAPPADHAAPAAHHNGGDESGTVTSEGGDVAAQARRVWVTRRDGTQGEESVPGEWNCGNNPLLIKRALVKHGVDCVNVTLMPPAGAGDGGAGVDGGAGGPPTTPSDGIGAVKSFRPGRRVLSGPSSGVERLA